jgi:hypothetical protein
LPQTLIPRARVRLAMAGLAAAALAAGCGSSSSGDSNADPASVVPSSAPIYASIVVKPEGDQKAQLEAVLKKVLQTDDPGAKVEALFDEQTKKRGVTWSKDVEPYIGNRVGIFFTSFKNNGDDSEGAVVIPVTDKDKALDSIRKGDKGVKKRSYRDVDYQVDNENDASAAVGDFIVAGSEGGIKAVIDTSKDSAKAITKDADFQKTTSAAGKDSLATVYLDLGGLVDSLVRDGTLDRNTAAAVRQGLASTAAKAIAVAGNASADGFSLDFAALGGTQRRATRGWRSASATSAATSTRRSTRSGSSARWPAPTSTRSSSSSSSRAAWTSARTSSTGWATRRSSSAARRSATSAAA